MMKKILFLCLLLTCIPSLSAAGETAVPCFEPMAENVEGIFLKTVPEEGVLLLGSRALRPGDVVTAEQIPQVLFSCPSGRSGDVSFLPVTRDGVLETAFFRIPGRKNEEPVAEDSAFETYRDLPNSGQLRIRDPEGKEMTVTVTKPPRRGEVTLEPGGKFTYTPKKRKVGWDSFSYTAADPEGNVSREATVTVTILKPSDAARYRDTAQMTCSFAAEWMKNTGIFQGETLGDLSCFQPEKPVTGGEFLTMLLNTLKIAPEPDLTAHMDQIPMWLRPYAAAALRAGIPADVRNYETPVTEEQAEAMVRSALDIPASSDLQEQTVSAWSRDLGFTLEAGKILTRGKAAELLYCVHLSQKKA